MPVWVSVTSESNREVLVYALLHKQSDTTFLLDDTAKALHVNNKSVLHKKRSPQWLQETLLCPVGN